MAFRLQNLAFSLSATPPLSRLLLPTAVSAFRIQPSALLPSSSDFIFIQPLEFSTQPLKSPLSLRRGRVQNHAMAGRKKNPSPEEMRKLIHSFRGKFKMKPGDKPFAEWWADHKREEMELEERKFQRLAALGKK